MGRELHFKSGGNKEHTDNKVISNEIRYRAGYRFGRSAVYPSVVDRAGIGNG
jgi:hypothetical protein